MEVIMRNIITRVIVLAAAAVAFGLTAHAQASQQYRAQVPFDFTVAGRAYTAGSYSVGLMSSTNDSGAISLLDRKTGHEKIIGMSRGHADANSRGKLTFVKNGDKYALVSVSTPSFETKMKQPERIAIAKNGSKIIEVALN